MAVEFRELGPDDYEEALELWQATGDMSAGMIDSARGLRSYLKVHRGLSVAAVDDGKLVGIILCGHENGAGQLFQLVAPESSDSGAIGQELLGRALQKLNAKGMHSCRLALPGRDNAKPFWESVRWGDPPDLNGAPGVQDPRKPRVVDPYTTTTKPPSGTSEQTSVAPAQQATSPPC